MKIHWEEPTLLMDTFIVSARKYRPQTFDTVVGQKSITNTLKNAIRNNQLAQAFLFTGPRGVGKTTCARILAKTINCENITPNIEACDQCPSCVSFNQNASFNIYELDGASNNTVDGIRTLIEQVRIPPQMGRYKVYIIDEVHMLSAAAFNAFLKTLEEPPSYAKFILATTEKHKILPTILSRCQIFDFRRITVDDIAGHLQHVAQLEKIEAEDNALHIIAQKADGAMRDALSIFDQLVSFAGDHLTYNTVLENLNVLDYEYFFKITDQILQADIPGVLLTINDIIEKGFEGQHFILGFGEHLRNLLVCKDPSTARLLETAPSIRSQYLEQAGKLQTITLLRLLDIHNKCDLNYKTSNNKKLHLELALMQMCSLEQLDVRPVAPPVIAPPPAMPKNAPPAPVKAKAPEAAVQAPPPVINRGEPESPAPVPGKTASTEATTKKPGVVMMKDIRNEFDSPTSIRKPVPKTGPGQNGTEEGLDSEELATPFTQDELILCWDELAESLKKEFPHLYSTMKSSRPLLNPEGDVELELGNVVLEEELNNRKTEMMEFMRSKLNNNKFRLITRVSGNHVNAKPYTDKEKFELMAGKNPALRNLKDELDLEIEY